MATMSLPLSTFLHALPQPSFLLAFALIAAGYLIHALYSALHHPLRGIPPAHPLAPYTSLWISFHRRNKSQAQAAIQAAHTRHGPIIRLAPNEISVASFEGAHRVYIERGGFAKPGWWADEFRTFDVVNLVAARGGEGWAIGGSSGKKESEELEHRRRKRDMGSVYAKSVLVGNGVLSDIAGKVLGWMVSVLDGVAEDGQATDEKSPQGTAMDVYNFNGAVNADFISAYLFGADTGFATRFTLDPAARDEYFKHHKAFLDGDLHVSKNWLEHLAQTKTAGLEALNAAQGTASVAPAVVYAQLATRHITGPDLASELLDHFIAGAEGPRTTITYMMHELSQRPDLQSRLRAEIRAILPSSSPGEAAVPVPDLRALDALPLLAALLNETLRVHTPTPGPQHRIVPPQGTELHGFFLPGGTAVSTCLGVLHANEEVFPGAREWRPERWLGEGTGEGSEEMRRWFWAFGRGSRGCIGKEFGVLVMKLIIATIYARYETSVVGSPSMQPTEGFLAHPKGEELVVRFRKVD